MRRRTFLKLVGLTSAAAAVPATVVAARSAPGGSVAVRREAQPSSLRYRGSGGRIYVSDNGGRSWKQHTNLGPEYSVTRLANDGAGGARATVAFQDLTFGLVLAPDLRSWLTD